MADPRYHIPRSMENSMAEKSSYHSPGYTLAAMCPSSFQKQTNRTPKVMPISLDSTFVSEAPSWSIRALPMGQVSASTHCQRHIRCHWSKVPAHPPHLGEGSHVKPSSNHRTEEERGRMLRRWRRWHCETKHIAHVFLSQSKLIHIESGNSGYCCAILSASHFSRPATDHVQRPCHYTSGKLHFMRSVMKNGFGTWKFRGKPWQTPQFIPILYKIYLACHHFLCYILKLPFKDGIPHSQKNTFFFMRHNSLHPSL